MNAQARRGGYAPIDQRSTALILQERLDASRPMAPAAVLRYPGKVGGRARLGGKEGYANFRSGLDTLES